MTYEHSASHLTGFLPPADVTPKNGLRPRQQEALVAVFRELQGGIVRPLVVLPTGVGKTMLAVHVAVRFKRVLFLVHREELLRQSVQTFEAQTPDLKVGMIMGHRTDLPPDVRITVGMIQTVHGRLDQIPRDSFDLIIVDEAHHAFAQTWRTTINHFNAQMYMGLSATPERLDGAPLSHIFQEIVYEMSLADAISEGYLVPPRVYKIKTSTSLANIRRQGGDLNAAELQARVNNPARNRLLVERYIDLAPNHKAVFYVAGVDHAKAVAQMFTDYSIRADAVWGNDPERGAKLKRHRNGESSVLVNDVLLSEGYDDPTITAIGQGRPTESKGLYAQILGRGLRLCPEIKKKECIVLDFVDNAGRHDLTTSWNFLGTDEWEKPSEKRRNQPPGERSGTVEEQMSHLLGEMADDARISTYVEHVSLFYLPPERNVWGYGESAWHVEPATDAQRELLSSNGYDVQHTDWSKGQAQLVIESFPPTATQLLLLMSLNYDPVRYRWTRGHADAAITRAKSEGVKNDFDLVLDIIGDRAFYHLWEKKYRRLYPSRAAALEAAMQTTSP